MNDLLVTWGPAVITGVLSAAVVIWKTSKDLKVAKSQATFNSQIENRTYIMRMKLEKAAALYAEMSRFVVSDFVAQFKPFLRLPKRKLTSNELKELTKEVWQLGARDKTWSELEILLAYFPEIQSHFHSVRKKATWFTTIKTWEPLVGANSDFSEEDARRLQAEYIDIANEFIQVQDEVLVEITKIQSKLARDSGDYAKV